MDKNIFSKFNLYDQIGYLMVGSIAILTLAFNLHWFYQIKTPSLNVDTFIIWFVFAYFLGHFTQGLSNLINNLKILNILIPEKKQYFNKQQREILKEVKTFFKYDTNDNNKLWNICYTFVNMHDTTGQIQAFNSYYSLYRGWLTIFVINSLFTGYMLVLNYNSNTFFFLLVSLSLAFMFFRRSKRFWEYTKNKVLEMFIINKKFKPEKI